ncbi:ABC transporter substrate-binding protein [Actinomadura livida]|uniref:Branched-chain amino acid transport system substrate-binding protein n=2 Tax=Actinomadura livida TaxID=79909 RepID=A0A7W7MYC1_9ACTN|nr:MULTISPECIES: ABC transporter substrate-binding protein [Actinomadura]MBB4774814.1 branched-chain amino acid transport system substrate-binding protein [Actinomadura catellatispora]
MRSNWTRLAAAAAVAMLAASGCGNSGEGGDGGTPSSAGPMKIEIFQALSGPVAPVGQAMSVGNKAAVAVVNANGGVLGKDLEVSITDDAGSPDQLAAKLQELLSGGKPHAVLPGSAAEIPAGIPILANAGVFVSQHFTANTFNDPKKYPLVFGNAHTIPDYTESLVQKLKQEGHASVGVVDSDDSSGQAFEAVAKPAFEEAGIKATFVGVPPSAVDATAQLQQALAGKPDALVFAGYFPGAAAVVSARTKLGVDIPTYSAQTFSANNLADIADPSAFEGIEFQQLAANVKGTPQTESKAFKTFYDAVLKEAGGKLPFPINTYLVAYDDVMLAAYAADLAGGFDPEQMAKAVENAKPEDMPNYVMPVGFSSENHFPDVTPEDFVFVPYSPVKDGMVVPAG